jgi:hypothetical protein
MYTPRPEDLKRLENDFTYHPPIPALNQADRYATIRSEAKNLAHRLLTLCPPSRELSLSLTHLEQAVFYANAAIARNERA